MFVTVTICMNYFKEIKIPERAGTPGTSFNGLIKSEYWWVPSGSSSHDLQGLTQVLWSRQSWGDPEEGSSRWCCGPHYIFRGQKALGRGGHPHIQGGTTPFVQTTAPRPAALGLTFWTNPLKEMPKENYY